jgi:hypothetical protein
MEPEIGEQRVHVVQDAGREFLFKSSRIQRESETAIYLETALQPPNGYYRKRLLIKGIDLIPRSEDEALRIYLEQLRVRLEELEQTRDNLRRQLEEGTKRFRSDERPEDTRD